MSAAPLHVETLGTRAGNAPALVLLHGWGMNLRVFDELAAALARTWPVVRIDLPGHGRSGFDEGAATFAQQTQALQEHLPPHCILIGWSLGGQFALELAGRAPAQVRGLALLCSTPRFVNAGDWHAGLKPLYLEVFAARLAADWHAVLEEFLALQVRGGRDSAHVLDELHGALRHQGMPDPRALATGLGFLRDNDLRAQVAQLALPALFVSGQHDRVTPPAASAWLARTLPGARHVDLQRAGHAPFLSHAAETAALLHDFVAELAA